MMVWLSLHREGGKIPPRSDAAVSLENSGSGCYKVIMKRYLLYLLFVLLLASCAHAISEGLRKEAVTDVPFSAVRMNIEDYKGRTFVWGGFIVNTVSKDEGTYMEVVQNPLNRYGRIVDTDVSGGRFLGFSEKQLDPLIYEKGRLVTVAGELTGSLQAERDGTTYLYPVLRLMEIRLWKEEPLYPPDYWYWDRYPYWWYGPWGYWPYYHPPPPRHPRLPRVRTGPP